MKARAVVWWLVLPIAGVILAWGLAFAAYGYHVLHSEKLHRLERESAAYPCIGTPLDPARPRFDSAAWLARFYIDDGTDRFPSLWWHLEYSVTAKVVDSFTTPEARNRLYAATPMSPHASFDAAARELAGKRFCALPAAQRQAILDYWWIPRSEALQRAFGRLPPA